MIKILFICHGNICRSTMAEYVMKDLVKKKECRTDFIFHPPAQAAKKSETEFIMEHAVSCVKKEYRWEITGLYRCVKQIIKIRLFDWYGWRKHEKHGTYCSW